MIKSEIISIGDELLIGQVINTNAAWMAQQLSLAGIGVYQVTVISDRREHILQALKEAESRADIILITGGLGPTNDDITKETLCEYFNTGLVFHEPTYEQILAMFVPRGFKVSDINRRQAEVPAICTVLPNPNGTAPGMWLEKNQKIFVSMPGVPFEMKPIMSDHVIPELARRFTEGAIFHKTILTQGIGESMLATMIADWENQLPSHIKLAYLPHPGVVRLRLSGLGSDPAIIRQEVMAQVATLEPLISDLIYGYDDDTLEGLLGNMLTASGKTVSTAESCTGGYLAHRITSIPGSSAYFRGSIIAYANEVKTALLKVSETDLLEHGAVSEEVVKQMAVGVRSLLGTDYAMATSGIAGPDGGSEEKPVGLVWIGIAGPHGVEAHKFLFGAGRDRNISRTAITAMNLLRKMLNGSSKDKK